MVYMTRHTVSVEGDNLGGQWMSVMVDTEREGGPQTASGCQAAIHLCNSAWISAASHHTPGSSCR